MIRIQLIPLESAREVHALAFPADQWVGDDHTFWVARGRYGHLLGFCSAIYRPEHNDVFLSRCAVTLKGRGQKVQRKLIRHRTAWARSHGAVAVVTYTNLQNYPSMVNLLREGFEFSRPIHPWAAKRVHYFSKSLE